MKEQASRFSGDAAAQLRSVLAGRSLSILFQPIYGFREGGILAHEALVRGPAGSLVEAPVDLFDAAVREGLALELNVVCIQEVLRAFARLSAPGGLFLNVSPRLILQPGFSQERAGRFMSGLGLDPSRVVIELTEDFPAVDFRLVRESLLLYRAMGFRVAIDDLGEGFSSLRLWSELKPEFVKADKHFVAGIARDPVKVQFLRAIQQIAGHCGSLVIAEGIEVAEDFRVVKDIGIACGQGWFIGRPEPSALQAVPEAVAAANNDARIPVVPGPRLRARSESVAQDFLRAVDAVVPSTPIRELLARFAASPRLAAVPVIDASGVRGVISRIACGALAPHAATAALAARPCLEFADASPICVEADLDLGALTAILVESDAHRMADGFVIASRGRYLGMGSSQDVMRALQKQQVLAARNTNPLTLLPGQVPINEHVERLLAGGVRFVAWYVEVDQMRGLNDGEGFEKGDALIHDAARLIESCCEPEADFVGHIAGSRFVALLQSEDWMARAERLVAGFDALVGSHVSAASRARGYFTAIARDGRESVRPFPKLVVGVLPVLPGVFESRHEVLSTAKRANHQAMQLPGSALYVDNYHANAYPRSLLFDEK